MCRIRFWFLTNSCKIANASSRVMEDSTGFYLHFGSLRGYARTSFGASAQDSAEEGLPDGHECGRDFPQLPEAMSKRMILAQVGGNAGRLEAQPGASHEGSRQMVALGDQQRPFDAEEIPRPQAGLKGARTTAVQQNPVLRDTH